MDVHSKLDEITDLVEGARAMPMSTSALVNRTELLAHLDELRRLLPAQIAEAEQVLGERERIVADAHEEAALLLAEAGEQRARLIAEADVVREARVEADRVVEAARARAARTQADVEDYVDRKLANFEVVLHKTLQAVARGRSKLAGRHELAELAPAADPPRPGHG